MSFVHLIRLGQIISELLFVGINQKIIGTNEHRRGVCVLLLELVYIGYLILRQAM